MATSAQKTAEININLLPGEEPTSTAGTAVHWALTIGRYLIIFTEIVAISIFVLSIKLSADKQNLKENIQSLTTQVSAEEDFEKEFRTVQNRINEVKSQRTSHFPNNVVVSEFLKLLPKGLALEALNIEEGSISFSGSFATPKELQTLISSFSKSDKLVGLNISNLEHPTPKNKRFKFSADAIIIPSSFEEKGADAAGGTAK